MATRTPAAFTLSSSEGRTPQSLNILGAGILVKVADADTHGAVAIFHHIAPPLSGPPLRRHSREDEWFYVLNGEITTEIDGERCLARGWLRICAAWHRAYYSEFPMIQPQRNLGEDDWAVEPDVRVCLSTARSV
jgi:Cupin domain